MNKDNLELAKIEGNLKEIAEGKASLEKKNEGKTVKYLKMNVGPNRDKKRDKGLAVGALTVTEREFLKRKAEQKNKKKKARKKAKIQRKANRRK